MSKNELNTPVREKRSFITKGGSSTANKEKWAGLFFIAPQFIGTSILVILPIIATVIISFTDWIFIQGTDNLNFIGLENYKKLMSDEKFIKSIVNNIWLISAVPLTMIFSLVLAIIINKNVYFQSFFKVIYFMPYISSVVAVAIVFQLLFHPSYGPINEFLMMLGIDNPPGWLADSNWSLVSVIIITIWTSIGFNLIIYLAGLQNISAELYEAADVDGASAWDKFIHITFPMLAPTSFFLLITGVIGSFKAFELIVVLTEGGPGDSTSVIVYYLYEQAFEYLRSGYASAISVLLLLLLLIVTLIQRMGQKKWTNY